MTVKNSHKCADCGAPTDSFLCDECAEICEVLTSEGKYYRYRKKRAQLNRLPRLDKRRGDPRSRAASRW